MLSRQVEAQAETKAAFYRTLGVFFPPAWLEFGLEGLCNLDCLADDCWALANQFIAFPSPVLLVVRLSWLFLLSHLFPHAPPKPQAPLTGT